MHKLGPGVSIGGRESNAYKFVNVFTLCYCFFSLSNTLWATGRVERAYRLAKRTQPQLRWQYLAVGYASSDTHTAGIKYAAVDFYLSSQRSEVNEKF